jgi:ankyrin repeat protein
MEATMAEARIYDPVYNKYRKETYANIPDRRCNSNDKVSQIFDEEGDARSSIYGSHGDDYIVLNNLRTIAYGCVGNDILRASGTDNEVYGDGGRDMLYGTGKNYKLYGGDGNDELHMCSNGYAYGGKGDDFYYYGCEEIHMGVHTKVQIKDDGGTDKLLIRRSNIVIEQPCYNQEKIIFGTSKKNSDDSLYICIKNNKPVVQCNEHNHHIEILDFFRKNNAGENLDIYKIERLSRFREDDEGLDISSVEIDVTNAVRSMLKNGNVAEATRLIKLFPKFIDTYTLIYDTSGKEVGKENHLGHASRLCNETNAKFLLEQGADVNAKDDLGRSALHLSVKFNCLKVLKLLVVNSADLEIRDNHGLTPLQLSIKEENYDMFNSLTELGFTYSEHHFGKQHAHNLSKLHFALLTVGMDCKNNNMYANSLITSMIKSGAAVHSVESTGRTPLHFAVSLQCKNFVEQLISNGADVSAKDKDGNKPFDLHADFKDICDNKNLEQPYKFACEKMDNPNIGNRITGDTRCYPNHQVEEFSVAGETLNGGQEIHDEL